MNLLGLYEFDEQTDRILITCALPYVNNVPHLGNLIPIISGDVYSRYLQLKGIRSIYICATDEHGTRTEIEAAKQNVGEDKYCAGLHDRMAEIFEWFNVEFTHFGRSSCQDNHEITREIFRGADENAYVVEEEIRQLYCDSCARYLPDTYVEGVCPHCETEGAKGDQCDACGRFLDPLELVDPQCKTCGHLPEVRATRHLFLRLDKLAPKLESWIKSKEHWDGVIRNMPLGWIGEGLNPRAITRDLSWGVSVPKKGFEDKVFYVWFDAPIGYIAATAEWARSSGESLEEWWKGGRARLVHFLGKDNVPFHTLMWPGALMAADAGWNLPDYIAANEYLNHEGGAFSKSRQRGVFSDDVMDMGFPADAVRFFLMANRPEKRDSDFSFDGFQKLLNASLVGNFGNLANRLISFVAKRFGEIPTPGELSKADREVMAKADESAIEIDNAYATFEIRGAVRSILALSDVANKFLQDSAPWATFKSDPEACRTTLFVACDLLARISRWMWPIMPERSEAVLAMMGLGRDDALKAGLPVAKPDRLFEPIEDVLVEELTKRFLGQGQ